MSPAGAFRAVPERGQGSGAAAATHAAAGHAAGCARPSGRAFVLPLLSFPAAAEAPPRGTVVHSCVARHQVTGNGFLP